ncbi:acetyl-coenzyme a synthetase, partial [Reticulomyxa filosa]
MNEMFIPFRVYAHVFFICLLKETKNTETGGIMITPLPGATDLKPGSVTLPFFGIEPALLNKETGEEIPPQKGTWGDKLINGNKQSSEKDVQQKPTEKTTDKTTDKIPDVTSEKNVEKSSSSSSEEEQDGILVIKRPWPGMARTVYGAHDRYLNTYMKPYPGYYFTGDGAKRDKDGYYWITGRVDDVLNVSGHRLGTAEIESAVVQHPAIAEAAVVGTSHDIKGYFVCICFVETNRI